MARPSLQVEALLAGKDAEKQATQTELDDLLMVFSDLEDKVARYKVSPGSPVVLPTRNYRCLSRWLTTDMGQAKLKALGEQISDDDGADDDDDVDDDDDE